MKMKREVVRVVLVGAMVIAMVTGLCGTSAWAEWTVTSLHPTGAVSSIAFNASYGRQVGSTTTVNEHAALWTGTPGSWIDLNPIVASFSRALDISDGQQVGFAIIGDQTHAALWTGTPGSWLDLNPIGASSSEAHGVSGNQQAGTVWMGGPGAARASLWTGTAASWIDLNPAGTPESFASDVSDGQQVGWSKVGNDSHASLWSGTPESWIDLDPAPAEIRGSWANGISDGQQVGEVFINDTRHAALWAGTPGSWIDLNPAGATYSRAVGVSGGMQVGYAVVSGGQHAGLWSGTPGSWIDLHTFLPTGYLASSALGIKVADNDIWVVGAAASIEGRIEAVIWHGVVPEPSSLLALGTGLLGLSGVFWRAKR